MFLIMLILLISLVIVIFSLQNALPVPIVFFNWSSQVPLVIIIFVSVLAGALIIFCLALWKELRGKFSRLSTDATTYMHKLEIKKTALSAKLDRFKTAKQDPLPDPIKLSTNDDDISSAPSPAATEKSGPT